MADGDKGRDIKIAVDYYFPAQNESTAAQAEMKVIGAPGAQLISQSIFRLGMPQGRIEIPIVFEPSSDKRYFSFDISFAPVGSAESIAAVTGFLSLRAGESVARQLFLVIAVIFYVIGSVVLGVKGSPWIGGSLQAIALVAMLNLVGKKVV